MPDLHVSERIVNVGLRLKAMAERDPSGIAAMMPRRHDQAGRREYETVSFQELEEDSNLLADGILNLGAKRGMRLVLMVRPSIDFISLVFAMFKVGVVTVLIDPGMGRTNLIKCLEEVEPEGFVAIPLAQAVRAFLHRRFPKAHLNVTVGRRWFWGGATIDQLRSQSVSESFACAKTKSEDPAAIIFTTGSTGPPKGVLYRHGNFDKQVDEIRDRYEIEPGEIDLAGFPLFGLFNCAMGVTTVIPDMDPTRPAAVDPQNIIEAVEDCNVTQAFASPALWNTVGRYCEKHKTKLPKLRRILSAGAPVPPHVLGRLKNAIHPDGEIYTPYGATEALPVASISASEVLNETAKASEGGAGTCVGVKYPGIQWKVIRITDRPIATIDDVEELPTGETGELIVRGPVVTREYVTRVEANKEHKVSDGESIWHRMGDVGYIDDIGRFWFCGRKAHRVQTVDGTMFTIPCETVINTHGKVYRSALVGVGQSERQRPVMIVETWPEYRPNSAAEQGKLIDELVQLAATNSKTEAIREFLIHPSMPVDIRHNAKIFREKLSIWAEAMLKKRRR